MAAVASTGYHLAPPTSKNTAPKAAAVRVRRIPVTVAAFARGALSEDTAQAQADNDCQRQENDGVNIHVALLVRATGRRRSTASTPTSVGG